MKVVLQVDLEDLDQALAVAKTHLINASTEPVHSVDFYLAGGVVKPYHSVLTSEGVTVWRSEVVEG